MSIGIFILDMYALTTLGLSALAHFTLYEDNREGLYFDEPCNHSDGPAWNEGSGGQGIDKHPPESRISYLVSNWTLGEFD